jgi:hypothetical protein
MQKIRLITTRAAIVPLLIGIFATSALGQDDFCWKSSYGRGAGTIPTEAGPGRVAIGALSYSKCPANTARFGFDCHSVCPPGLEDQGLFCRANEYGRGVGYPWKLTDKLGSLDQARARCARDNPQGCEKEGQIIYPKCRPGYRPFGSNICRPSNLSCTALGLNNGIDLSCAKKVIMRGYVIPPAVPIMKQSAQFAGVNVRPDMSPVVRAVLLVRQSVLKSRVIR